MASSGHAKTNQRKRILVAETVLPNARRTTQNRIAAMTTTRKGESKSRSSDHDARDLFLLSMNVQFSLVGRQSARTLAEWEDLATEAGLEVESVQHTTSPSCSMITLLRPKL